MPPPPSILADQLTKNLLAPLDFRPSYGPLESIGMRTRPAENTSSSFEQKLISFFAKSLLTLLSLIVQWITKVTNQNFSFRTIFLGHIELHPETRSVILRSMIDF